MVAFVPDSSALPCTPGSSCGYLDIGYPDHDIDHGVPRTATSTTTYLDHGSTTHALGYLDFGIKGYHPA